MPQVKINWKKGEIRTGFVLRRATLHHKTGVINVESVPWGDGYINGKNTTRGHAAVIFLVSTICPVSLLFFYISWTPP